MSVNKEVFLTAEGLAELKKELDYLKLEKRPAVIESLKDAREQGDLSENAEYDAARTAQAEVEAKIQELEEILDVAKVVEARNDGAVSIGSQVTILYVDDKEEEVYHIVGSMEVDPLNNKISNESPIAKAIMNKKVGDIVTVVSPNGEYSVKIIEIK